MRRNWLANGERQLVRSEAVCRLLAAARSVRLRAVLDGFLETPDWGQQKFNVFATQSGSERCHIAKSGNLTYDGNGCCQIRHKGACVFQ